MRLRRSIVVLASLALLLPLAALSFGQEMLYLAPEGEVAGYNRPSWSPEESPVILLFPGDTVPVTKCLDIKSDILLVVHTQDQDYFIGAGAYKLLRRRASPVDAWLSSHATFSCWGLFSRISRRAPNNSFKPMPLRGAA